MLFFPDIMLKAGFSHAAHIYISPQFVGVSRDGYVSLLDEEGHMRSDLEVSDNDTVKTLRDKMNADTDTDVTVSGILFS